MKKNITGFLTLLPQNKEKLLNESSWITFARSHKAF